MQIKEYYIGLVVFLPFRHSRHVIELKDDNECQGNVQYYS